MPDSPKPQKPSTAGSGSRGRGSRSIGSGRTSPRRTRPPTPPRPRASRQGSGSASWLPSSWPMLAALALLIIGGTGALLQNADPDCPDRSEAIPQEWADDVARSAEVSGLPPEVIAAQLDTESGWDPQARSPVGAQGLAQFMPETWEHYGHGDATDPEESIRAQGRYLRDLRDMMAQLEPADEAEEIELVLAAYNAGPTVVLENRGVPAYAETRNYVAQIRELADTRYADACSDEA